ncbi:protein kinase [Besnoitia besnoiti]|uniref:Protein kinase n=1 Tax=Besnoitia besnoiti TaxID=94643 RepID=A0A2A9MI93_BESBE|nr:protein kinase [Besnoitia besnoiti]PFH35120.1 protein kinase [Besnoitia besnoiti]
MGYPCSFEPFVTYEPWNPEEYNELKVLAKAIHGTVHLTEHLPSGQLRAVKKIPNKNVYKRGSGQLENALVEIGASLYLSRHAIAPVNGIIKTFGAYRDETDTYLVTEYASGGELFNEAARLGHMDEEHARRLGLQLLLGVKSLHDNGVCHRDLSLENTLLHSDGSIRIIDFGQAEPLFDEAGKEKSLVNAAGKMYYRAPEMYSGSYLGSAVDIFAVGVVLFIVVFGTPPWLQATNLDDRYVFIQTCQNGFERLLVRWKRQHYASKELRELIRWMILADPQQRPTADIALAHQWFVGADPVRDTALHLSVLRNSAHQYRVPRNALPKRSSQTSSRYRLDRPRLCSGASGHTDDRRTPSDRSAPVAGGSSRCAPGSDSVMSRIYTSPPESGQKHRGCPSVVPKKAAVPPSSAFLGVPQRPEPKVFSTPSSENFAPTSDKTPSHRSVSASPTSQKLRAISLLANRLAGLRFCRPSQPQASGGCRPLKRHLSDSGGGDEPREG